jgi:hypothetical protein
MTRLLEATRDNESRHAQLQQLFRDLGGAQVTRTPGTEGPEFYRDTLLTYPRSEYGAGSTSAQSASTASRTCRIGSADDEYCVL